MKLRSKRRGFTFIEMIFVIIILGIMGTLASEIILNLYRSYVMQKGAVKIEATIKTTTEQISNYLERSITSSLSIVDSGGNYSDFDFVTRADGNLTETTNPPLAFVWIGKDVESMQGIWNGTFLEPGYSGFANVAASFDTNITTSDCDLSYVGAIEGNITGVANSNGRSALYFVYADSNGTTEERFWSSNPSSLFPITQFHVAENNISLSKRPHEIGDIYYLSYSAYALQYVQNSGGNDGNLTLTWNFRPWNGEDYANNGTEHLMLEDVTRFQIWSESGGSIIRLFICATDDDIRNAIGSNSWEYCKESVIVR